VTRLHHLLRIHILAPTFDFPPKGLLESCSGRRGDLCSAMRSRSSTPTCRFPCRPSQRPRDLLGIRLGWRRDAGFSSRICFQLSNCDHDFLRECGWLADNSIAIRHAESKIAKSWFIHIIGLTIYHRTTFIALSIRRRNIVYFRFYFEIENNLTCDVLLFYSVVSENR